MDENNKCAICLEVLSDPRVLPCWHGACLGCIKRITRTEQGRLVTCHMCREVCAYENVDLLPVPISCKLCKNFVVNPLKFPCCDGLCCADCIKTAAIDGVVSCGNKCDETVTYSIDQLPRARICPECFVLHTADGHDCGHYFCSDCIEKYGIEEENCSLCGRNADDPLMIRRILEGEGAYRDSRQEADELLHLMSQLQTPVSLRAMRQHLTIFWKTPLKMFCLWFLELLMVCIYGLCVQTWVVSAVTILALRFNVILCVIACVVTNAVLSIFSVYYFSHAVIFFVTVGVSDWFIPPHYILPRLSWQLVLGLILSRFCPPIFVHKTILELAINILLLISIKDISLPYGFRSNFRSP